MKYLKFPITVSDQIIILKERGLFFENEMRAHNYLSNISYYRLRAYTFPFQDNTNERQLFNVNITFE